MYTIFYDMTSFIYIYIPKLSSVQNKCGSFCMDRTTFRDP